MFQKWDLVMIYLRKKQFSVGTYNKLSMKKLCPFQVLKWLGENAYLIGMPPEHKILSTFNVVDL